MKTDNFICCDSSIFENWLNRLNCYEMKKLINIHDIVYIHHSSIYLFFYFLPHEGKFSSWPETPSQMVTIFEIPYENEVVNLSYIFREFS